MAGIPLVQPHGGDRTGPSSVQQDVYHLHSDVLSADPVAQESRMIHRISGRATATETAYRRIPSTSATANPYDTAKKAAAANKYLRMRRPFREGNSAP